MIELKSAVCPECGGRLKLNFSRTSGKCASCGYDTIISGVPGFRQEEADWISANHQLEDGETDKAAKYFKRVIEKNPEFGEAYFGVFMCEIHAAEYYLRYNAGMARCIPEYLDSVNEAIMKYGKRAIEYAPDEAAKDIYSAEIQKVQQRANEIANPPKKKRFWQR